jgi:anaerobic magnesium-protoporphyrin IX monomethyl ester cyclase
MTLRIGYVQAVNVHDALWYQDIAYGFLASQIARDHGDAVEMRRILTPADVVGLHVLGVSFTSQDYGIAKSVAEAAKQVNPRVNVVGGGHHVSFLPQTLSHVFDVGVIGEGERTFSELVGAIARDGGLPDEEDLATIQGIAYHDGGQVVTTEPRPAVERLDDLPIPVRLPGERPFLATSRGCPFRCSFCASQAFWRRVRFHSPERVVAEIEQILAQYPGQPVNIQDDLFVADRKRFARIVYLLEERGLAQSAGYSFSVRANLVDDELCRHIARLKVDSVCFGAESGTDRILAMANKGLTVAVNQRALDVLAQHGIRCTVSAIVGWPTETEAEVRETYDFLHRNVAASKLSPGSVVNVLSPMPGSRIWAEWVEREHINVMDFDWNRLGLYANWRHSSCGSFDAWREARRQANTVYLGTLEQERMLNVMAEYEGGTAQVAANGRGIVFPESRMAHLYLDGRNGIEVGGSAHNPFNIARCRNVDVTDDMGTIFKAEERNMCGRAAKVDVVAPADKLPMPDESEGYVLSSHVLEHIWDVFGCLKEWDRVLERGGIVFCIVPLPTALPSDIGRPMTTVAELVERHERHTSPGPEAVPWGHHNVFSVESLAGIIDHARTVYGLPWVWREKLPVDDKVGNGSLVVLQKGKPVQEEP